MSVTVGEAACSDCSPVLLLCVGKGAGGTVCVVALPVSLVCVLLCRVFSCCLRPVPLQFVLCLLACLASPPPFLVSYTSYLTRQHKSAARAAAVAGRQHHEQQFPAYSSSLLAFPSRFSPSSVAEWQREGRSHCFAFTGVLFSTSFRVAFSRAGGQRQRLEGRVLSPQSLAERNNRQRAAVLQAAVGVVLNTSPGCRPAPAVLLSAATTISTRPQGIQEQNTRLTSL